MRIKLYYFFKNVFLPYLWGFLAENQRIFEGGKIRKYDEEIVFWKKAAFIFRKGTFTKMGGRKIWRR